MRKSINITTPTFTCRLSKNSGSLKLLETSGSTQPPRVMALRFTCLKWGYAVTQLVEALRYKLEDRGFDSQMESLEFFSDLILPVALWPWTAGA